MNDRFEGWQWTIKRLIKLIISLLVDVASHSRKADSFLKSNWRPLISRELGITITQGCNQSIDQQSYFWGAKQHSLTLEFKISKFFAMPSFNKNENLLYQINVLLLNNRLYHPVGLLSIKHHQHLWNALWPDETSSTPGNWLSLSNACEILWAHQEV